MIQKSILDAVSRFSLIEEGATVTVALSGGADSMCLLHALVALKDKLKITVRAAHFNHLIRGEEAFRDEEFVKTQCNLLGVSLITERADVPKYSKEKGISLELAARTLRYDFLKRINEGVVATAHTASDNLETVILNLTRGTSIYGLCGIPIKRDIFIRPLLYCSRALIEEYCEANEIPFVTDSTNLSDDYTRNKIRHSIIPVMKELNPSVENTVLRSCSSLKEISEDLSNQANSFICRNLSGTTLSLEGFEALPSSIAKRVIVEFIKIVDSSISLENCHIEEIYGICLKNGKISIPNNNYCVSENRILKFRSASEKNTKNKVFSVKIIKEDQILKRNTKNVNNLFLKNSLDCDKIIGKLVVRTRLSGDSIRLKNRGCTKPLTKLYNECGIPLEERETLPVIADDKGVVWIYGIGVAHRAAVNENSKNIYSIEVKIEES